MMVLSLFSISAIRSVEVSPTVSVRIPSAVIVAGTGDSQAAATLLMIEKLEELVARQVEAISNLKIDKITVWDSGGGDSGSSTANFISNLFKSLPPLQDISEMAGFELPAYLGKMAAEAGLPEAKKVENISEQVDDGGKPEAAPEE